MATAKMGIDDISAEQLVAKAQGIHDKVAGNVAIFAAPQPTVGEMQDSIEALAAANALVVAERSRSAYSAKRTAERAVREGLKKWVGYVQMVSGGDASIIDLSGFEVSDKPSPVGELNPPVDLGARLTNTTGRVSLRWERQYGADMHHVYMSTSDSPYNWQLIGVTSKSRFDADSLQPGTFYFFAVSAIGAAGESSKSEPCRAMAAA